MKNRMLRRVIWAVVILAVLITVVPSLAGRLLLQQQLRELGASRADIRVFHLNLWSGRFTLKGLRVDAPGKPLLIVDQLVAQISYPDLTAHRLHLSQLQLSGVRLSLHEQQGRWELGPLRLPLPEADRAQTAAPPGSEAESESAPAWQWGLSDIDLTDLSTSVVYHDSAHQLRIDTLQLPSLYQWAPEKFSNLILEGALNGHRFAVRGDSTPLAIDPTANAKIRINALPLGPLLALWQPEQHLTLTTDLQLRFAQQEGPRYQIETEGMIRLDQLSLSQPQLNLASPRIDWQGAANLQLSGAGLEALHSDSTLSVAGLALESPASAEGGAPLRVKGELELGLQLALSAAAGSMSLSQNSQLDLTQLAIEQAELSLAAERISWRGQTRQQLTPTGLAAVTSDGELNLQALNLKQGELNLAQQSLRLQGLFDSDARTTASFAGSLALQGSRLHRPPYRVALNNQRWRGQLRAALDTPALQQLDGQLDLDQLELSVNQTPSRLQLGSLGLQQFKLDQNNRLTAERLELSRLNLSEDSPLLELEQFNLAALDAGPEGARLGAMQLGGVELQLRLDEKQQPASWNSWIAHLSGGGSGPASSAVPANQAPQPPTAASSSAPYPFRLASFELGAPLRLSVVDPRIKAGRPLQLTLRRFKLGPLDSRSNQSTPFAFEALINRFGSLEGQGEYALFSDQANGSWQLQLKQLELPPLSPYMKLTTGYQIDSGQLHLNSSGSLQNNLLDSDNQLVLNRFEVERGDKEKASEFNGQLGMPLELAVAILTDDKDNVTLDIPVKGSLEDPEFGIQSVVNILLTKVAKQGAISYLGYTLQPFGTVFSLGSMALDAMEGVAIPLEPIPFAPGAGGLDDQGQAYLGKLSELLQQREALELKLCGTAVAEDDRYITALAERIATERGVELDSVITESQRQAWLYNLAQLRGEEVKSHLTEVQGIDGRRLFSCLPKPDSQSEQPPRVQVGL